jgi:NTE family protein
MGLGAYQAGAYVVLQSSGIVPRWIAGSSVGAINGALIAGTPPDRNADVLRQFWQEGVWTPRPSGFSFNLAHAQSWLSAIQGRVLGVTGHFRPRGWISSISTFESVYDLTPMRRRLEKMIDFERLNAGEVRFSVATADVETGQLVVFDTQSGPRIEMEHLLASCGFLPEFAPIEIGGRLLGDGGLVANAPIEIVFGKNVDQNHELVIVVDLFSRDGPRPNDLETALERKNDLMFAAQTVRHLEAVCTSLKAPVIYLSYRTSEEEAGPEKTFDFSHQSIERRWNTGSLDMADALTLIATSPDAGLHIIRRNQPPRS